MWWTENQELVLTLIAVVLAVLVKMGATWALALSDAIRMMARVLDRHPLKAEDVTPIRKRMTGWHDATMTLARSALKTATATAQPAKAIPKNPLWRRLLGLLLGSLLSRWTRLLP